MVKTIKKSSEKKSSEKKFLKYAFISGIILVILSIIGAVLNNILPDYINVIAIILEIFGLIFSISFTYGFIILGRRHSKFLKIVSILMIIFSILFSLCSFFTSGSFEKNMKSQLDEKTKTIGFNSSQEFFNYLNVNPQESENYSNFILQDIIPVVLPFVILVLSFFLIGLVLAILFGAGLIKIGSEVKYAKVAGILSIVGACTIIIFVGFLVLLIAYVYMMIILYRESKK
jgi:hypothetical protein